MSLYGTAATVWGYELSWLELAAVVVSYVGVVGAIRRHRWAWVFYFLGAALYGLLLWHAALFGTAALQGVFMAAAVWGWFGWGADGAHPQAMTRSARSRVVAAVLVGWLVMVPVLTAFGDAAPWPDAFALVGSAAAQVMMVRQHTESWAAWVVVDVVGTVLYATQGLWFTSVLYATLTALGVSGWYAWRREAASAEVAGVG